MPKPDYGLVAETLARVIDAVEAEVVDDDQVVLETISRFVGGFDFRRMIPASNSVEFNLDMAGREVETNALVADRPETGDGIIPTSAVVGTKREKVTIYFPEAEECLKDAFTKTSGGVQFVFVGPGFFEYLKAKGLMKEGRLGTARVVMRPKQPDRDVFLIGRLEGAITSLQEIPREKLARVTVITKHPSLLQQMPQIGGQTGPNTWRLMSVQEQREFLAEMPEDERDIALADALQGVRDGTAKATLRNLFPEMSEEKLVQWFYRTIRRLRPCSIKSEHSAQMQALRESGQVMTEEEFQAKLKEKAEECKSLPPIPECDVPVGRKRRGLPPAQDGRVVANVGSPIHPPTTVESDRKDGDSR